MFRTKVLLSVIAIIASLFATASHLVGGELYYTCVGDNDYEITLTIYRDCYTPTGSDFDNPAYLSIFNGTTNIDTLQMFFRGRQQLPLTPPNNCTQLPPFVCVEKSTYRDTLHLPPSPQGYTIVYQRCCRNNSIVNLINPGDQGNTYVAYIPANDSSCNSTPRFLSQPPVVLCLNYPVTLNLGATDPDGDSLSYGLCTPFQGADKTDPRPERTSLPPFQQVFFAAGYNSSNPIKANPVFTINASTGELSGRPTQVGQYVFAICVEEWRNGQYIGSVYRDFQFNVSDQCLGSAAVIVEQNDLTSVNAQDGFCIGRTVSFEQTSINTSTFLWDFGDPSTSDDTSSLASPTYTYADTGVYTVSLISNPGTGCPDTNQVIYRVFDPVEISFTTEGSNCFEDHSLNFYASGIYSPKAKIQWEFSDASQNYGIAPAGSDSLKNVTWSSPGTKIVTVRVNAFGCTSSYTDSIIITPYPKLIHDIPFVQSCVPFSVSFTDSSIVSGTVLHFWDFGDGSASNDVNPIHTYDSAGIFDISHTIVSLEGCMDTVSETAFNRIQALPSPKALLYIENSEAGFYQPDFNISNLSEAYSRTTTLLPNGEIIDNLQSYSFQLADTGFHKITHIAYNDVGCTDTLEQEIYVSPPFNVYVPNSFTPNGDGINDLFSYTITGDTKHQLKIFNRWGEVVFQSKNTQNTWAGSSNNKSKTEVYTYVLVVENPLDGTHEKRMGMVTVFR